MKNVLIADDDRLTLEGLQTLVDWQNLGLFVAGVADSGTSALKRISAQPPDMLITDISMPGMSGVELAREALRVRHDMYVIFLTGYADFGYAQEGLKLGVKDYILKPIDYQKFAVTLAEHVKKLAPEENRIEDSVDHAALKGALKYMRANIERGVSLNETADAIAMSASNLSRLFKGVMGSSFSDVYTNMRMEHVKLLLDDPSLRVSDIADRMGFRNMTLFHAKFKEIYGVTPGMYKRGEGRKGE